MLMFLRNKNVYYEHQCAIKVNVVYVVTYDMVAYFSMTYDIEIWHP